MPKYYCYFYFMISSTEENYLKAIFKIAENEKDNASTNSIAKHLATSPASVTDMLKKLSRKELINYKKYKGVTLTQAGSKIATKLIRRHRLWEVFLVNKLKFSWDKVHEIAEELEHIPYDELINRLDIYLGQPKFDPHGDPIPNAAGKFTLRNQVLLSDLRVLETGIVIGVKEHDAPFLQYLTSLSIKLGTEVKLMDKIEFDQSMKIEIDQKETIHLSEKVSNNLLIKLTR